ncbi:hypothetical protein SVIOM74S_03985 [Streptomyces violarus]
MRTGRPGSAPPERQHAASSAVVTGVSPVREHRHLLGERLRRHGQIAGRVVRIGRDRVVHEDRYAHVAHGPAPSSAAPSAGARGPAAPAAGTSGTENVVPPRRARTLPTTYPPAAVSTPATIAPARPGTARAGQQRVPQPPGHPGRQHPGGVPAFGLQSLAGADAPGHQGLGQALGVRARAEVAEVLAGLGHPVMDHRPVVDQQHRVGPGPAEADAQFRLLAAQRAFVAVPADAGGEAARRVEGTAAERGVATEHVAHPDPAPRQAPVGAAHHPVELLGEPVGPPPRRPDRLRAPADRHHARVGVRLGEVQQPVALGHGVVVEEGDDLAARGRDSGVAAGGQAAGARVGEHPHVVGFLVLLAETVQKGLVVVDDQQRLQGRP